MKRVFGPYLKKSVILVLGVLLVFAAVSCDNITFDLNLKEAITEKLDVASVESVSKSSFVNNKDGHACVPSSSYVFFTVQIRNPRNYNVGLKYEFDDETDFSGGGWVVEWGGPIGELDYDVIYGLGPGGNSLVIAFSPSFLQEREIAGQRDISGNIILYDTSSGRTFNPYHVDCRVNTPPPAPSGAMMQRNASGSQYVLCFFMPRTYVSGNVNTDTHVIRIGNTPYYFKSGIGVQDNNFYTDSGFTTLNTVCSLVRPSGLQPLEDDADLFSESDCPAGYVPVYYTTNANVTLSTVSYTLVLEDDEGLRSNSVVASNNTAKLAPPSVSFNASAQHNTEEDGYFYIPITHSGMCLDSTSAAGNIQIFYSVYDDEDELVEEDSFTLSTTSSSGSIPLSRGTYNTIRIYARKPGFTSSETVILQNVVVHQSANYYVSSTGSDENLGTSSSPFRTIGKAMAMFSEESSEAACNIYLMSDITQSSSSSAGDSFVTVSSTRQINIIGYNGQRAIDAQNINRVIDVGANAVLTLRNITVKNGNSDDNGGGIYNVGTLTLDGCTITNCTADCGGGIYDNGTLTLDGETSIPAGTNGSNGIYLAGTKTIAIGSNFSWKTGSSDGLITLASYASGRTVLTGAPDSACEHIALGHGAYEIGEDGKVHVCSDLYVSSTGSDTTGDGSQSKPFRTLSCALSLLTGGSGAHTIHVSGAITGCTSITSTALGSNVTSLTISGTSATSDILDGYNSGRVLYISSSVPVTLENLTIKRGNTDGDGGGILNNYFGGTLTLNNCTITDCTANDGGGIYNNGTLTINSCTVTDCTADGGIGPDGGGICNDGTLTLDDCTITNCTASCWGGGVCNFETLILNGCTITNCTADFGGGIFNWGSANDSGTLTLNGETSIPAGTNGSNGIYLGGTTAIAIGNSFTWKTGSSNGLIDLESYASGRTILTGAPERAYEHFALENASYEIGEDGNLVVSTHIYISSTGSDTTGDGSQTSPFGTLSKALEIIDYLNSEGAFTIHVSGTINGNTEISSGTLGSSATSLRIIGTSATNDILDGNNSESSYSYTLGISGSVPVMLENLTIQGGNGICGIYNQGTLTLDGCTITDCTATDNGGGGIYNNGGMLTLDGCTITNCTAYYGGGIHNGGELTLDGCTITDCTANYHGGGIYNNSGGTLTLDGCTITDCTANYDGGGIYSYGTLTLNSCTVTDCTGESGGGIYNGSTGTLTLDGCTIANCTSTYDGGGIYNLDDGTLTLDGETSIPAGTNGSNGIYLRGTTAIAIGNSFTWKTGSSNGLIDLRSTSYANGRTVLTGAKERAYNKFNMTNSAYTLGSDGKLSVNLDYYVSSTGSDTTGNGSQTSPFGTLSEAVTTIGALNSEGAFTIHVSGTITGCTTIDSSTLGTSVTSLTISGTSATTDILDGNNAGTVLQLVSSVPVTLENLKIQNGNADDGGGINNSGTLTLDGCTITNCTALCAGGINNYGTLTLDSCTITDCTANYHGGGIFNDGNLTLDSCTIMNCSANWGGGISNGSFGTLTLDGCTITNCTTSAYGGGIYHGGTTLSVSGNVSITGNTLGSEASNVYLENEKVINVSETLANSSVIGITTHSAPASSSPVEITNNLGSVSASVFESDAHYAVIVNDSGKAVLAVSGGSYSQPSDQGLTFEFKDRESNGNNVTSFNVGSARQIFVTLKNGSTVIAPTAVSSYTFKLYYGGHLEATLTHTVQGNTVRILIPANLEAVGTYHLIATATYNSVPYTADLSLNGEESCFVPVDGATVSGAVSGSEVFIAGRTITIPNMYVCDHEITQAEFREYCEFASAPSSTYGYGNNFAAYRISWYDALVYCNKRSIAEGLTPCYSINGSTNPSAWGDIPASSDSNWDNATCSWSANGYRLPTEAEWEYIVRGGNNGIPAYQTTYSGSNVLSLVSWYEENSGGKANQVKQKQPNMLGIYDMSGNVYEWCWDWRINPITSETPTTGAESGTVRVCRGGSWDSGEFRNTVYNRMYNTPYDRSEEFGFRIVRTR